MSYISFQPYPYTIHKPFIFNHSLFLHLFDVGAVISSKTPSIHTSKPFCLDRLSLPNTTWTIILILLHKVIQIWDTRAFQYIRMIQIRYIFYIVLPPVNFLQNLHILSLKIPTWRFHQNSTLHIISLWSISRLQHNLIPNPR